MKFFKIRISVITCLLQAMLILLPIISIMMVHFVNMAKTLENMELGFFGNSKTYLLIHSEAYSDAETVSDGDLHGNISFADIYNSLRDSGADAAISKNVDSAGNIQLFCYTSSYANIPMLSGYFFEVSDFTSDNYVAVVGKNMQNKIYETDGTSYISVNDIEYKVIGVMGYFGSTPYDNRILLNGMISDESCIEKIISVDIFDHDYSASLENFNVEAYRQLKASNETIASGIIGNSGILTDAVYGHWFIFILICDIISLVILSVEWVNRNKRNVAIKRMLGCTDFEILYNICLRYGGMLALSAVVSFIYCRLVFNTYFRYLFYGFGYFIIIIIPLMLFLVKRLMSASIEEAIK